MSIGTAAPFGVVRQEPGARPERAASDLRVLVMLEREGGVPLSASRSA